MRYSKKSVAILSARFWPKVRKTRGCWEWTGCCSRRKSANYGKFRMFKKIEQASRAAWILTMGRIPNGLHVLHTCDNPPCVRPSHLYLGTHAKNMADCAARGRVAASKRLGISHPLAKLTDKKIIVIRSSIKSDRALALDFSVARSLINAIRNRKIWRHIDA